ncbi:MAG: M15 family metallopeptidase [Candidatus Woykebacteria bacterium]
MKINPRFFLYPVLILVVAVVALVQINKQQESPSAPVVDGRKTQGISIKIPKETTITASVSAKKSSEISAGVIVTDEGDNLLVLINKNIRLPETYEPADLVSIDGLVETTHPGMMLRSEAAKTLSEMAKAAKKRDVNLMVLSAYRSYWNQEATFSSWVGSAGFTTAETFSARAGYSQHQLGTAVDFTAESVNLGLAEKFDTSREGKWLFANAYKFGWVLSYPEGKEKTTGYIYEPWHWRYIGTENAQKMIQSGLILEEFLKRFGVV